VGKEGSPVSQKRAWKLSNQILLKVKVPTLGLQWDGGGSQLLLEN